jgi:ribokinase
MLKNTVTTIGGATRDIMFYTDDMVLVDNKHDLLRKKLIGFEYGAKVYSKDVSFTFGGGGMNTAINFAGLGIKTQTILSIGDDMVGHQILAELRDNKISTRLVQTNIKTISGTSFVINVGRFNEHVIFAYRGANSKIDLTKKLVAKINTPWVYLTSLPKSGKATFKFLFDECDKKKQKIAWNPGTNQLKLGLKGLSKYMKCTHVFDVNRDEALELVVSVKGKKTKDNIKAILKFLHQYGQEITVITDGHRGAHVYDGSKYYYRAAQKRAGINTTGAGDAFGSSFVAGLIKYNGDIQRALKLAIINSNSVISKIGAQEGLLKVRDLNKYNL